MCAAAIGLRTFEGVQRHPSPDALGQVGIGDEHPPERDGIGQLPLNRRDRRFGDVAAGGDHRSAYRALRSVLHVLRNRLTPEQAVHMGAQLPLLVRGIFYDGWRIAGKPSDERQPVEFATLVAADLPPSLARDASRVTRAVFGLLEKEVDRGETDKIIATLPHPLRVLRPAPISQETPPL